MKDESKVVGTIDCTPTWEGVVPIIVMGLQSKNKTAYDNAMIELKRMAKAADKFNKLVKEIS